MYNFSKKQKILIGIILGILAIILINYVYSKETKKVENTELNTYEEENKITEEEAKPKEIVVHVAGAVKTEGIIFLQEGDRISNAIEKAGGTTEEADMTQVNLATAVEDGMKIYIPKKGENMKTQEETTETTKEKTQTANKTTQTTGKVNINKATQEELEELPGIGPSTATKIIEYREENGKFSNTEDIKKVSGIGDAKYNTIKDLITI